MTLTAPDHITDEERRLIADHTAKHGVTICPPFTHSRNWGADPMDGFEIRDNQRANYRRGQRLAGAPAP